MKDLAFKAVGVGSVGTFCCVALFLTATANLSSFRSSRLNVRCLNGWVAGSVTRAIRVAVSLKASR